MSPVSVAEVQKVVGQYIKEYNNCRLHSSLGYMRPVDYYKGNAEDIKRQRYERVAIARERRLAVNREFNRMLKLAQADFKHGSGQNTSYLKPSFYLIYRKQDNYER